MLYDVARVFTFLFLSMAMYLWTLAFLAAGFTYHYKRYPFLSVIGRNASWLVPCYVFCLCLWLTSALLLFWVNIRDRKPVPPGPVVIAGVALAAASWHSWLWLRLAWYGLW